MKQSNIDNTHRFKKLRLEDAKEWFTDGEINPTIYISYDTVVTYKNRHDKLDLIYTSEGLQVISSRYQKVLNYKYNGNKLFEFTGTAMEMGECYNKRMGKLYTIPILDNDLGFRRILIDRKFNKAGVYSGFEIGLRKIKKENTLHDVLYNFILIHGTTVIILASIILGILAVLSSIFSVEMPGIKLAFASGMLVVMVISMLMTLIVRPR